MLGLKGGSHGLMQPPIFFGDCSPNGREMTVGSSFVVSTAAIISSGEPSSDRSASNGWVTDSGAVQVCALSMPMRKSASDHDHSFSLECPETVQPDSSHVMSGDQRSTSRHCLNHIHCDFLL